ncbi:MAG: cell division protein FtsQ/DivIB [Ectothiorhodospiraceae bacterium]|nr:cell division protein FtsQ/DivIB [Ectothiorhodospiraceae bacterium]
MRRNRVRRGAQPRRPQRQPVDPAVRARRRAVLARTGSVAGVGLLVVMALGGAAYGIHYLRAPETFPLQSVHFDTRLEHVRERELREALAPHLGVGFWGLDVERIRGSLQDLPWVDRASVRRVWPGMLRISIQEQDAVATWNGESLMNPRGELFTAAPETWPGGLPELAGPPGREREVSDRYRSLDRAFGGMGKAVLAVTMDARESWKVTLDGGVRVQLGRHEIEERVQRFVRAWPALTTEQEAQLAAADLRYPNGFAVRWENRPGADGP